MAHPNLMLLPGPTSRARPIAVGEAERAPAEGSRRAVAEMAREHRTALVAMATRLSGNTADANDLVQDTLERALKRAEAFEAGTNARAWLFSILHNAFIDRCRRRKAAPPSDSIDDVEIAAHEAEEPPVWTALTAEQIASAVARLDEEFRVVYELHAVEGLSYQAISERLTIPANTVGTRLARARRKLRAVLEATLEEGGMR